MHAVESTGGGQVTDEKGKTYDTRLVLPVSATNSVPAQVFAGGSKPRDDRRRNLSRELLQPLKEIVARGEHRYVAGIKSHATKTALQTHAVRSTHVGSAVR